MNLKEENHIMKLELNRIFKKNEILEKDLNEIRRIGEEACKSQYSNNMMNFYHVSIYCSKINKNQIYELDNIKKENKQFYDKIFSFKNISINKSFDHTPFLKAIEILNILKETFEIVKSEEIINSSIDSLSFNNLKLVKHMESNYHIKKKTKECYSRILEKKRNILTSKNKKSKGSSIISGIDIEGGNIIKENFIIDSPVSMLRYCKSSKGSL